MFSRKRADSANNIVLGKPIVVPPSGKFDGNDGQWSSFLINIGGDGNGQGGQNFRVLPSTFSAVTMVPRESKWCNETCSQQRGVEIFQSQQAPGFKMSSQTWREYNVYGIPVPKWWSGTKSLDALWGEDNVGLGSNSRESEILESQWVVVSDIQDLFMGSFGLAAGAVDPGNRPKNPFLRNLAASNTTPSTSYGYTAGAIYQNNGKGVLGSLVLGGFDQSRFSQKGTNITMPSNIDNSLVVGVRSITYHGSSDDSLSAGTPSFSATIDSTLPYLYLPETICKQFETKFGLKWDNNRQLYTVDSTAHDSNRKQKATVTFTVGDGTQDSKDFASITLPYDAFDLQFSQPGGNATNYFPIRKSQKGPWVLGRTFLQEAYIVVDYERTNFAVAPVIQNPTAEPQIIPIYKKDFVPPNANTTNTPPGHNRGKEDLAAGAIAGIVVGIVLVFLLGLGTFFFWRRRRAIKRLHDEKPEIAEIDTMYTAEIKQTGILELDSNQQANLKGYYGNGHDNKDVVPFPAVSEMESPPVAPAELYSPPASTTPAASDGKASDYFTRPRRRGATRESSGNNTPGTPGVAAIHELAGDDGQFQVGGIHFEPVPSPQPSTSLHSRGPSDPNIDQVISGKPTPEPAEATTTATEKSPTAERRPSHARGASDTTVQSDVSQPTPEEMAKWAMGGKDDPRRPISE